MEKKKRLGRGLDEVADLWLSSPSTASEHPEEITGSISGTAFKTISVIYPESLKVKGVLVVNIALEMAKLGFGSCILDYEPCNGSSVRSMIGNLFQNTSLGESQENSSSFHQVVRLYGMPSIHIFSHISNSYSGEVLAPLFSDGLFSQITSNNLQDSIIFLYHQDTLEVISMMKDIPSIIILTSRPRRESLLTSYAYIKAVSNKNPQARIWVILDEVVDRDEAVKAFTLLSETTSRFLPHLNHPLKYLGSMIHDQALGISFATRFPLVLTEENSLAKDSIKRIANNLVKFIENPD